MDRRVSFNFPKAREEVAVFLKDVFFGQPFVGAEGQDEFYELKSEACLKSEHWLCLWVCVDDIEHALVCLGLVCSFQLDVADDIEFLS